MKTLLIAILILFCISMLPINIILSSDNGFSAKMKILFFSFNIPPKKKEKKKMDSEEFKKEIAKLRRKKSSKPRKKANKKKKKYSSDDIPFYFDLIKNFVDKTYHTAKQGLTVKVQKVNIIVANEDPSKTAIMYGIISQGLAYLLEFLESLAKIKYKRASSVNVSADFSSVHTTFDVKIVLSWRIYRALYILITTVTRASLALSAHNKHISKSNKKEKKQINNEITNKTTEEQ